MRKVLPTAMVLAVVGASASYAKAADFPGDMELQCNQSLQEITFPAPPLSPACKAYRKAQKEQRKRASKGLEEAPQVAQVASAPKREASKPVASSRKAKTRSKQSGAVREAPSASDQMSMSAAAQAPENNLEQSIFGDSSSSGAYRVRIDLGRSDLKPEPVSSVSAAILFNQSGYANTSVLDNIWRFITQVAPERIGESLSGVRRAIAVGYSDRTGNPEQEKEQAARNVGTVVDMLKEAGVDSRNIVAVPYGAIPANSSACATPGACPNDRKVDVFIYK